jgi:hypothetical protein
MGVVWSAEVSLLVVALETMRRAFTSEIFVALETMRRAFTSEILTSSLR